MAVTIDNGTSKDSGTKFKRIQLDCVSTNTDNEILAELAAYDAIHHSAIGSEASSDDLEVFCKKRNNGSWRIIRSA
jgi:hypothetical protein